MNKPEHIFALFAALTIVWLSLGGLMGHPILEALTALSYAATIAMAIFAGMALQVWKKEIHYKDQRLLLQDMNRKIRQTLHFFSHLQAIISLFPIAQREEIIELSQQHIVGSKELQEYWRSIVDDVQFTLPTKDDEFVKRMQWLNERWDGIEFDIEYRLKQFPDDPIKDCLKRWQLFQIQECLLQLKGLTLSTTKGEGTD